jgi:4-hydroxybenzoate polyprenyltransferase
MLQLKVANWRAYQRLMRMDKPIGIYLLLWPTLWALWVAANGMPHLHYLVVFTIGVVVMRAAGCVINDYADRHFDGHVERTQLRPLPAGEVTEKEALQLFGLLILIAFGLVLTLDVGTMVLSVVGLLLAASYPFMKRYTHFPQVVLGAAFSWSMPMAFMAVQADLPVELWLLYFANLFWTVAYDTLYAMVDKDDDLKIGVKSTAIAFGENDLLIVAMLQAATLSLFYQAALLLNWQWPMFVAMGVAFCLFAKQIWECRFRERQACFKAFLDNHYVGLALFAGIFVEYSLL